MANLRPAELRFPQGAQGCILWTQVASHLGHCRDLMRSFLLFVA